MKNEEVDTFYPTCRKEWREWLRYNHQKKKAIWLIYYKKKSNISTVTYSEAVDEALCFGWIDSKIKPINEDSFMQLFSKRKPNSVWSKVNKEKVNNLINQNLITKAGHDAIVNAKQNGSWSILDEAEALIIPKDLEKEFDNSPTSKSFFLNLSRSDKRNILQWLALAKKKETRQNRIIEIIKFGDQNLKPKQFQRKNKGN